MSLLEELKAQRKNHFFMSQEFEEIKETLVTKGYALINIGESSMQKMELDVLDILKNEGFLVKRDDYNDDYFNITFPTAFDIEG